ncbi:MAG: T6SS immunity protein Tli4 family protein [Sideroxyarcus sp.]|nr:T6SS immunity protein Tli4 family protein [Sideroxyarcus sp.]
MNIAHIKRYLAIALLATTLCGSELFAATINQGKNNMTELTKTMKTVCVGRLVIEIPEVAHIKGWDQEVERLTIESISPPSISRKAFDAKVHHREIVLKTSPHKTEGHLLKSKVQPSPDSVLFVYREDGADTTGYGFDAFFWRPGVEYQLKSSAANSSLDVKTARISKVVQDIIATPTTNLATLPPGLCIEHGVITGADNEYRREHVAVSGRIDAYPGLTFSFSTQSASQPSDDLTLIQRTDRSLGMGDAMGKEVSAATKFLRKGKRKLNGQNGEEMVAVITINGETSIEASAEFYAEPKVLDKPNIEVSLSDQTHDDNNHKPYGKNLTEKEFLALWDTMLNSIKPRPKNQWGSVSIKK